MASVLAWDLIEADHRGDLLREQREAAGDEAGVGAVRAHGPDQRPCARRQRDVVGDHIVDHRYGQPFKQGDALAQRGRERDLTAHRPFGDGGDMRLEADKIGKLVDAFLLDHGRIHVGEEQPLAAVCDRLHDHVDGRAGECIADGVGQAAAVEMRATRYRNVGRDPLRQPRRCLGGRQPARNAGQRAPRSAPARRGQRSGSQPKT